LNNANTGSGATSLTEETLKRMTLKESSSGSFYQSSNYPTVYNPSISTNEPSRKNSYSMRDPGLSKTRSVDSTSVMGGGGGLQRGTGSSRTVSIAGGDVADSGLRSLMNLGSNLPPPPATAGMGGLGSNKNAFNPMASPKLTHAVSADHSKHQQGMISTPTGAPRLAQSEKVTPVNIHSLNSAAAMGGGGGSGKRYSVASSSTTNNNNNNNDPDDFLATHFNELTQAAENALKSGLRNLSVPVIQQKLANFVRDPNQHSRVNGETTTSSSSGLQHLRSTGGTAHQPHSHLHHQRPSSFHSPPMKQSSSSFLQQATPKSSTKKKPQKPGDKFIKSLLESNLFDSANTANTGSTVTAGSIGDGSNVLVTPDDFYASPELITNHRAFYHYIDFEHAKDIYSSLNQTLIISPLLPMDQQEIAMNLFYQISDRIEKTIPIQLPVLLLHAFPAHLPDPIKPMKFTEILTTIPTAIPQNKFFIDFISYINQKVTSLTTIPSDTLADSTEEKSSNTAVDNPNYTFKFIVNPFGKKNKDDEKNENAPKDEIYWPRYLISYIHIILKNPLAIPIHFTSVKPIFDDTVDNPCKYILYPITADLPAECDYYEIYLPIKFLSQGEIKMIGIEIMIGNFMTKFFIDKKGYPSEELKEDGTTKIKNDKLSLDLQNIKKKSLLAYRKKQQQLQSDGDTSASSSSSISSVVVVETNEIKILDSFYSFQCYLSWEINPLININGPTPNHVTISKSKLSIYPGEMREEKIWLVVDEPEQTEGKEKDNAKEEEHVNIFQVFLHEYEQSTLTKRSYLLLDYLQTENPELMTSASLIQSVQLSPAQQTSSNDEPVDQRKRQFFFELSFTVYYKPSIANIEFEIHSIRIKKDLFDCMQTSLLFPIDSAFPSEKEVKQLQEERIKKLFLPSSFLLSEVPVVGQAQEILNQLLHPRKILLSVQLQYQEGLISSDSGQLFQVKSSMELYSIMSLLSSHLQQQREKDRLFHYQSLLISNPNYKLDSSHEYYDNNQQHQQSHSQKHNSSSSFRRLSLYQLNTFDEEEDRIHFQNLEQSYLNPKIIFFTNSIILQFTVTNKSVDDLLIGTSLASMKKRLIEKQSGNSEQGKRSLNFSTTEKIFFRFEEILASDYLTVIPSQSIQMILVEYPRNVLSSDSLFSESVLPLYWLLVDPQKTIRRYPGNNNNNNQLLQEGKLHQEDPSFRCGRIELTKKPVSSTATTELSSKTARPVEAKSSKYNKNPVVESLFLMNLGLKAEGPPPLLTAALKAAPFSEVAKIISSFPALAIDTNVFMNSKKLDPSSLSSLSSSASSAAPVVASFSCQPISYSLTLLQQIEIKIHFQLSLETVPLTSKLEILLLIDDSFHQSSDHHFNPEELPELSHEEEEMLYRESSDSMEQFGDNNGGPEQQMDGSFPPTPAAPSTITSSVNNYAAATLPPNSVLSGGTPLSHPSGVIRQFSDLTTTSMDDRRQSQQHTPVSSGLGGGAGGGGGGGRRPPSYHLSSKTTLSLPSSSCSKNILSYLLQGKMNCKYSLKDLLKRKQDKEQQKRGEEQQQHQQLEQPPFSSSHHEEKHSSREENHQMISIHHKVKLSFLSSSKFSLFIFFRFIDENASSSSSSAVPPKAPTASGTKKTTTTATSQSEKNSSGTSKMNGGESTGEWWCYDSPIEFLVSPPNY
jgi:hypothetical protein